MKNKTFIIILCLASFAVGIFIGKNGIPFIKLENKWSIGIYEGRSPFDFAPSKRINNPVLTAVDVKDVKADFVADPFMVKEGDDWYMFFEVMNSRTEQGDIGMATSNDGLHWAYKEIVLDEPFNLSYPYVFKWDGEYYMIPESSEAYAIRLYKAVKFPGKWEYVKTILEGDFVDTSVLNYDGKWWLFTTTYKREVSSEKNRNNVLRLYYSDNLTGPWAEHPKSPIVADDPHIARPGGRVLISDGKIIRYAQDDYPSYGRQVRAFEITELTASIYKERELSGSPVLKAGSFFSWNALGMHTIDPHQTGKDEWLACVDGYTKYLNFKRK